MESDTSDTDETAVKAIIYLSKNKIPEQSCILYMSISWTVYSFRHQTNCNTESHNVTAENNYLNQTVAIKK